MSVWKFYFKDSYQFVTNGDIQIVRQSEKEERPTAKSISDSIGKNPRNDKKILWAQRQRRKRPTHMMHPSKSIGRNQ